MGISAPYVYDLETGRRQWNLDLYSRYGRALAALAKQFPVGQQAQRSRGMVSAGVKGNAGLA